MTWSHTSRGRALDLLEPQPDDVDLDEIATALGNQCRYAGCVRRFYSVAEHSWHIAAWLNSYGVQREVVLGGLLHDAAEAYTGDLIWPVQQVLWQAAPSAKLAWRGMQQRLETLIAVEVGIKPAWLHHSLVREADERILLDERAALLPTPGPRPWLADMEGLEPLGVQIYGWRPEVAASQWRALLRHLIGRRA